MSNNKFNLRNVVTVVISLAIITMFSGCNSGKKEIKVINLSFEGMKYDRLYLLAYMLDENDLLINGKTTDGNNWTFVIPDTISTHCRWYVIINRNDSIKNQNYKTIHHIAFRTIINNDTLLGGGFNFGENENIIELKSKFVTTNSFVKTTYIEELDTTLVLQKILTDLFSMSLPQNEYLRETMQTPNFSFFTDKKNPNKSYEEFLIEYADKIKKNPNSHYYMSSLAPTAHYYKSKKDIENLFNLFSPKIQNSIWGQEVKATFERSKLEGVSNIFLQNPLTKENEKIILEPTKHTLLCFSASWCVPCRKKIPLLKEIYENTKDNLNLVYITTDESTTIENWNALMEKENIMWRNLWLTDKNLKIKWQISAIPDYFLIYPDETAEKILLDEEKHIQELYSILNK